MNSVYLSLARRRKMEQNKQLDDNKKREILEFLYGKRKGSFLYLYYIKGLSWRSIGNLSGTTYMYVRENIEKFEKGLLEEHKREIIEREFDRVFGRSVSEREKFIDDYKMQHILYDNGITTAKDFVDLGRNKVEYLFGVGKAILPKMLVEYDRVSKLLSDKS